MSYNINYNRDLSPSNYNNSFNVAIKPSSGYTSSSSSSSEVTTNTKQSIVKPVKEKKVYQCNQCSKFFSRPSALETHTYSHTQEKPFQCLSHNCGRRFSVVSNLRRHFKVHQKPYNNNNKISSQDRLRCVRKLIRRNSRSTINATNHHESTTDCYGNSTRHKPRLLQKPEVLTNTLQPYQPRTSPENTITHYFHDSRVKTSLPSYMYRTLLYSESQNINQLIGERSTTMEYQPSDIQDDLNAVFTNFDDFSFFQQS